MTVSEDIILVLCLQCLLICLDLIKMFTVIRQSSQIHTSMATLENKTAFYVNYGGYNLELFQH